MLQHRHGHLRGAHAEVFMCAGGATSSSPSVPALTAIQDACYQQPTCDECTSAPGCGWCDTACVLGTSTGPDSSSLQCTEWEWQTPANSACNCTLYLPCADLCHH